VILGGRDLFEAWRFLLTTTCTIYALVITARSLWGWYTYLAAPGRVRGVMRTYATVQLLRLRFRTFAWEFAQIGLWLVLLLLVLSWHSW
jgi:hypothetical protein